jgi:peroxin-13
MALTPEIFARWEGRSVPAVLPDGRPAPPKPSRKPLLFFLLAAFGLPYVMSKVIRSIAHNAEEEERRRLAAQQPSFDPSNLEFCRVLYDFNPPQPAVQGVDMDVKKGDLVAVLSKSDPLGNPSEWWRCRARDGRIGYLPSTFLEVARRPGQTQPLALKNGPETRTNSLTSVMSAPAAVSEGKIPATKPGDVSADSFMKTQFYS